MHEAMFYEPVAEGAMHTVRCLLCPHRCVIESRRAGICGARKNRKGVLEAVTYGRVSSLALDPIEKKPLYHFYPGSRILSFGSLGCNLRCAFCQNWQISQITPGERGPSGATLDLSTMLMQTQEVSAEQIAQQALEAGAIGVAYTYNEPYINYEFVLDCCRAVRAAGLQNVLVSNGFYNPEPLAELLDWVDAFNIDIKSFRPDFYRELCGGNLQPVLDAVKTAAQRAHVEVTLLLIPETNDDPQELDALGRWLLENCGAQIPLHVSAYHPNYRLSTPPTAREGLAAAREIFLRHLKYVYIGNISSADWQNTRCASCGALLVERNGYRVGNDGLDDNGCCRNCAATNNFTV